ncbi:peptidoglycan DD-metalloendopeptidase family protein [Microbacterium sp. B2969]|uniref:Peptidoglycan DD-metalloendopeptidase family protein n=1 Tax=Microbacterium alkaliflavum TaxID=3248839 RepID=A0ABW7Q9K3_9MICO
MELSRQGEDRVEQDHALEECGCAPSPRERRALWPSLVNRRTALGLGVLAVVGVAALAGPLLPPAFAADYPSWDDVQAARASESAKAAEVQKIQGLIEGLTAEVSRTQAEAERTSAEFYQAQQDYFDAAQRADQLQQQADQQAAAAIDAANKAGRVAAQLYRNGGDDTSLELFFAGSAASADDLLARLGTMDQLIARNQAVYADAITARDSAQSLSDQAVVARDERDRLQQVAEQKMVAAQQAADAAQAALDEQQAHLVDLQAQLSALQDKTAQTIAGYEAGVEAARKAAEEAAAKAAAEAAAKAASAAGSGGGGRGGAVAGSGWARPSSGYQSSGYGPRTVQCGNGYCSSGYHYGVDLASGCGSAIYAAQSGTVVYAGRNGGYGNYIKLDHGGGIGTGYGHIQNGGILVRNGQWVNVGQVIAYEGNTGNSFGCHLHFETYVNGFPVNPINFMADRGISV